MANEAESLKRLIKPQRGKGRLQEAAAREALATAISEALPATGAGGNGVSSPLVEQNYTGSTYYSLVSSDGLFVFEFPDQTEYLDANSQSIVFEHQDPSA
jgi:hypothetical protein